MINNIAVYLINPKLLPYVYAWFSRKRCCGCLMSYNVCYGLVTTDLSLGLWEIYVLKQAVSIRN